MFVATTNFLSALILSRRICMLSAGLSCAALSGAKPNIMIASAAPIVFFTKSNLIGFLLQLMEYWNVGRLEYWKIGKSEHHSIIPPFQSLRIRVNPGDLRSLNTDPAHQPFLVENKSIHALLQRCRR